MGRVFNSVGNTTLDDWKFDGGLGFRLAWNLWTVVSFDYTRSGGAGSVARGPGYCPLQRIFNRQDAVVVRVELQGHTPELKIVPLDAIGS